MSELSEPALTIHRILVAVDASPHSQAALEAAVDMASRFQAKLLALFVEDINVLRMAELPFVREAGQYSALRRHMELERIERRLRARSRHIGKHFQSLVLRKSVNGTFRVARGIVRTEIQTAAQDTDVLIVGRAGWSQIRGRRLGSTARAACCDDVPSVTVILHEGKRITSPVLVAYDGSQLGDHALGIAAALVERLSGSLWVLLLADQEEAFSELRVRADDRLQGYDVGRQYQVMVMPSIAKLARDIRVLHLGALVLPVRTPLLHEDAIPDLIEEVDVPVVLAR